MTELRRVVLIGFSGTGKSALAPLLAARLGWTALDTDSLIEEAAGQSIPDLFSAGGEAAFRGRERDAVRRAAALTNVVIATGGGVFMDAENRRLLAGDGIIVALEARVDTIAARQAETALGRSDRRPLLDTPDPLTRIRALKAARQPFYALADITVHSDSLDEAGVVAEIMAAIERRGQALLAAATRLQSIVEGPGVSSTAPPDFGSDVACAVQTADGAYPVYVGWGLLQRLPEKLDAVAVSGRLFVVTDETVQRLYGEPVLATLRAGGRAAELFAIPPGELHKNLESLARVYDWLASRRAERGDTVIALGGGMVTDLAGTAAATYLRGMALLHVPTTLLGMVDAAIGGKVAVDLPAGKNLVGAFHQPRAVVADVATLRSLPPRELTAGWAEVIKHALIRDPTILDELERDAATIATLERDRAVSLIARNVAIKAAVVAADEREADLRMILNYGHTIAHALEVVTAYGRLLHGEAVAVGMVGAAEIASRMGRLDSAIVERHREVLSRFGLPVTVPGVDPAALVEAMRSDKKVAGGRQHWVLLESLGNPLICDDVPEVVVRSVLVELTAGG